MHESSDDATGRPASPQASVLATASSWVQANCTAVDSTLYGGASGAASTGRGGGFLNGLTGTLYNCAAT